MMKKVSIIILILISGLITGLSFGEIIRDNKEVVLTACENDSCGTGSLCKDDPDSDNNCSLGSDSLCETKACESEREKNEIL